MRPVWQFDALLDRTDRCGAPVSLAVGTISPLLVASDLWAGPVVRNRRVPSFFPAVLAAKSACARLLADAALQKTCLLRSFAALRPKRVPTPVRRP